MLRHIVLINFNPDATDDQITAWRAAATAMCESCADITAFNFGKNCGTGPNNYDSALAADFTDWAAFRQYIDSPAHQDYVRDHASKVVGSLAAIQHEL